MRLEPAGQRAELVLARDVEAMAPFAAAREQRGLLQVAEVLRDGAEGDVAQRAMDVPGGLLPVPHEAQDLAPPRGAEGLDHRAHGITI